MKMRWYEWIILIIAIVLVGAFFIIYMLTCHAGNQSITVERIPLYQQSVSEKHEAAGVSNELEVSETNSIVNINTADQETLETLPGIGTEKAKAIIEWREENGVFMFVDELLEIDGIGEELLDAVRDYIVLG